MIQVMAAGRPISFTRTLGVASTQGWTTHHLAFHSLDHREAVLWFGVWTAARGDLEWRGWRIEESGPFNVLHRSGATFEIPGMIEGRDYETVLDPALGNRPWRGQYDAWHEPVPIRTALPDGTRFRASWYQAAVVYGGQVTCCPAAPELWPRLADEAARVRKAFAPRTVLMMHDEIRAMNWDASCRAFGPTPGAILARHVRECTRLLAGTRVFVWGDMFDPYQNAVRDAELVHGDLAGSWEGLAPEVGIVNWNARRAAASSRFFARRGHAQVIAGYYDGAPAAIRSWLAAVRDVPGVIAAMYTTWRDDYDDLEAFARAVRSTDGDVGGPAGRASRNDARDIRAGSTAAPSLDADCPPGPARPSVGATDRAATRIPRKSGALDGLPALKRGKNVWKERFRGVESPRTRCYDSAIAPVASHLPKAQAAANHRGFKGSPDSPAVPTPPLRILATLVRDEPATRLLDSRSMLLGRAPDPEAASPDEPRGCTHARSPDPPTVAARAADRRHGERRTQVSGGSEQRLESRARPGAARERPVQRSDPPDVRQHRVVREHRRRHERLRIRRHRGIVYRIRHQWP
jgi:hypothetical protein